MTTTDVGGSPNLPDLRSTAPSWNNPEPPLPDLRALAPSWNNPTNQGNNLSRGRLTVERARDAISGAAVKGVDLVKNNADFLAGFLVSGGVSFVVAAGLHRPDLAITFPALYSLMGEAIPLALLGAFGGLSEIEKSRIGKPLIGLGKPFTEDKYHKSIAHRVSGKLIKIISDKTYHQYMSGILAGGITGAVVGGAVEFLAHQAPAPHAAGGGEIHARARADGAFQGPPSHSGDVPPPRSGGVDRNDAFHPFMSSDTVSSDVSLPPAVDVTSVTQILNDPTVRTSAAVELLTFPQFADNHTHEALNLASRLIEQAKTHGVLTPEKMQQIIDFADKTFQTIHEAKFGAGPFDLNAYRDGAGQFVQDLYSSGKITQDQYAAFQAVNFPAGHSDKVVAWQQLFNIFLGGKG